MTEISTHSCQEEGGPDLEMGFSPLAIHRNHLKEFQQILIPGPIMEANDFIGLGVVWVSGCFRAPSWVSGAPWADCPTPLFILGESGLMKTLHQVPTASAFDLTLVTSDLMAVTVPLHSLPTMPHCWEITALSFYMLLIYSLKWNSHLIYLSYHHKGPLAPYLYYNNNR